MVCLSEMFEEADVFLGKFPIKKASNFTVRRKKKKLAGESISSHNNAELKILPRP